MLMLLFLLVCTTVYSQEEIDLDDREIPNVIGDGPEEMLFDAPFGKVYYQVGTPTLKLFLPVKEKNRGTAVILCPVGSYSALVYGFETKTEQLLAENGIAGIVLKYRLPDPRFYENKEIPVNYTRVKLFKKVLPFILHGLPPRLESLSRPPDCCKTQGPSVTAQ